MQFSYRMFPENFGFLPRKYFFMTQTICTKCVTELWDCNCKVASLDQSLQRLFDAKWYNHTQFEIDDIILIFESKYSANPTTPRFNQFC